MVGKEGVESGKIVKVAAIFAATLSRAASQYAFRLFRDRKFRQLENLDNLEKIEQDRIFEELPKAHIKYLESLGIEKKYLNDWKKLIGMRYEEYSSDKHETRQAAMVVESKEGELTTEKISDIQLLLPVHTVAIGCHHHICRQKVEGKDELFKVILRSLSQFYVEMRVPIEGGKITPLGRIRARLRHLWNKIGTR